MMNQKDLFLSATLKTGTLFDLSQHRHPTIVYAWKNSSLSIPQTTPSSSFMGFIFKGETELQAQHNSYRLKSRQYFCLNEDFSVSGGEGIIIANLNFHGLNSLGGPLEKSGRLAYIDGCTDSLLVPPVKFGDPCLNALYFPAGISQTQHTHPSIRIGMVVEGEGKCITPNSTTELIPGLVFVIEENGLHSFHTDNNVSLTVVAYHPDSDFGPKDDCHPMINRTMVNGESAANIPEIQTQK